MRTLTVLLLLASVPAAADDRATVEKAALAALAGIPQEHDTSAVAKGGVVFIFGTTTADSDWVLALTTHSGYVGPLHYKPGKLTVAVHGSVAWWIGPVDAHADQLEDTSASGDLTGVSPYDAVERFGGLAVKTDGKWQLVALALSHTMPDKQLLDPKAVNARDAMPDKPKLDGDAALAAAAASWIRGGFASHVASSGTPIAAGTAPSELQIGPGAAKLAASWDKLGLAPENVTATVFPGGAGFVNAAVRMPRKSGKGAVAMSLAMFVVRDGDAWKWVALQFTP
jgi:hypothetical protein